MCGWKLHLAAIVASVWIPLAAELTRANTAYNERAQALIRQFPTEARYVLGDVYYNDPELRQLCWERHQELVTTLRRCLSPYRRRVEVRRVFHKLRSLAMENFHEHLRRIFALHGSVPTKGLRNTRRFALGAIFVYQLALLYRFEHGLDLNAGLKPFLHAACRVMTGPRLIAVGVRATISCRCRIDKSDETL